ncbi:MAG TPA: hypothetical protein VGP17_09420 [Solirubrobacteraceae bacterium]|jgi:hypothetical protein|nr:hypothetical protein [Solirubrobacteraceae bacterium]
MGVVARKQELFESVARLRRVGRELPGNEDVARVRLGLERELGPTVSLRLAAKLLGVSHTALGRWVAAGDVPALRTPAGSRELPVPALLDLYEETRNSASGEPARYVLAPAIKRRRQAAREMRVDVRGGDSPEEGGHDRARERGLTYHRAIAERLTGSMVAEARHVMFAWREEGRIDSRYADRWQVLLAMPLPAIRHAITANSSAADDLRQNSPFAGMLSEPERRRILAEVR